MLPCPHLTSPHAAMLLYPHPALTASSLGNRFTRLRMHVSAATRILRSKRRDNIDYMRRYRGGH